MPPALEIIRNIIQVLQSGPPYSVTNGVFNVLCGVERGLGIQHLLLPLTPRVEVFLTLASFQLLSLSISRFAVALTKISEAR
jgi:hypothetical protein